MFAKMPKRKPKARCSLGGPVPFDREQLIERLRAILAELEGG